MNVATHFILSDHIRENVGQVFSTMLAAPAVLMMDNDPLPTARLSGAIGIAGETVTGAVFFASLRKIRPPRHGGNARNCN